MKNLLQMEDGFWFFKILHWKSKKGPPDSQERSHYLCAISPQVIPQVISRLLTSCSWNTKQNASKRGLHSHLNSTWVTLSEVLKKLTLACGSADTSAPMLQVQGIPQVPVTCLWGAAIQGTQRQAHGCIKWIDST